MRDYKKQEGQKKGGGSVIKVAEKAGAMIKNFLEEQKDPHTVRILLQSGAVDKSNEKTFSQHL